MSSATVTAKATRLPSGLGEQPLTTGNVVRSRERKVGTVSITARYAPPVASSWNKKGGQSLAALLPERVFLTIVRLTAAASSSVCCFGCCQPVVGPPPATRERSQDRRCCRRR